MEFGHLLIGSIYLHAFTFIIIPFAGKKEVLFTDFPICAALWLKLGLSLPPQKPLSHVWDYPFRQPVYWRYYPSGEGRIHLLRELPGMKPECSIPLPPPPTEVPDYVWSRRYDRPCFLPGRPSKQPKETGVRIPHPDAEIALKAAKKACCGCPGRWYGRSSSNTNTAVFLVYEGNKVVERHIVTR